MPGCRRRSTCSAARRDPDAGPELVRRSIYRILIPAFSPRALRRRSVRLRPLPAISQEFDGWRTERTGPISVKRGQAATPDPPESTTQFPATQSRYLIGPIPPRPTSFRLGIRSRCFAGFSPVGSPGAGGSAHTSYALTVHTRAGRLRRVASFLSDTGPMARSPEPGRRWPATTTESLPNCRRLQLPGRFDPLGPCPRAPSSQPVPSQ